MADRTENARIGGKYRARHAWERADEGSRRMRNATAAIGTDAPIDKLYKARGWTGGPTPATTPAHAWDSLPEADRAAAERALKVHTGGDIEFMSRAYGAAIDQKYLEPTRTPASMATPYNTAPLRQVGPRREPRGVVGHAIKRPDREPHAAHPTQNALETVAAPVPDKLAQDLLPHLANPNEATKNVPNFYAVADYARRKALQDRGLA